MKKLLVIVGPTAIGKTSLAIALAKKFNGEVISADSRQVYKGMDIGTGKDLSRNSKFQRESRLLFPNSKLEFRNLGLGFYTVSGVRIWGYDLVEPKKDFSVAQYIKIVRVIIDDIFARGKLVILTGGTGLYIKALIDGIETVSIPPNPKLRKSLSEKTRDELFDTLAHIDPIKAASLNSSDRKNPRRLIRAIEIALQNSTAKRVILTPKLQKSKLDANTLFIGLTAPKEFLFNNIEKRVEERVRGGIKKEIEELLGKGVSWKDQSMSSLGYREWKSYFESNAADAEAIENWKKEENKYAKRQLTWFKRDKRIGWFDVTDAGWQRNVEFMVEKWYISR